MRDYFDAAPSPTGDAGASHWHARLQRAAMVWMDLAANACPVFNTRRAVSVFLREVQVLAAQQPDQRCLYFIASRKRLRFSARQPRSQARLQPCDATPPALTLRTEQGRQRVRKDFTVTLRDLACDPSVPPCFPADDRFIHFSDALGQRAPWAIHDLFQRHGAGAGEGTKIHYVGKSGHAGTWPVVAPPAGLIDMMLLQADGDRDFFIVCNQFAVTASSAGANTGCVGHVLPDHPGDTDPDIVDMLLEKALLCYFQPPEQLRNAPRDEARVHDCLQHVSEVHRIASLTMHFGLDDPHDYFTFYTSREPAQACHTFRIDMTGDAPRLYRQSGTDSGFPLWTERT